jgi:hypothetical protein
MHSSDSKVQHLTEGTHSTLIGARQQSLDRQDRQEVDQPHLTDSGQSMVQSDGLT